MAARSTIDNSIDCALSFVCGQVLTDVMLNKLLAAAKAQYNRGDTIINQSAERGIGAHFPALLGFSSDKDIENRYGSELVLGWDQFENPGYNRFTLAMWFRLAQLTSGAATISVTEIRVEYNDGTGTPQVLFRAPVGAPSEPAAAGLGTFNYVTGTTVSQMVMTGSLNNPPASGAVRMDGLAVYLTVTDSSGTLAEGEAFTFTVNAGYAGLGEIYFKLWGQC